MMDVPGRLTIKRFLTGKTLLFLLLATIITLVIGVRLVKRQQEQRPGIKPTFGELLAPLPAYKSPHPNPQTSKIELPPALNLPETAVVYRQGIRSIEDQRARQIGQALRMGVQPQIFGNTMVFQQEAKFLSLNLKTGDVSYSEPLPEYLKTLSQPALEDYALLLIKQLFPDSTFWENPVMQTQHLATREPEPSPHGDLQLVPPESAQLAIVEAFPTINGTRIVGPKDPFGQRGIVTAKFLKNDGLISLNGAVVAIDISNTGTYPLKSLPLAQQEIGAGRALFTTAIPAGTSYGQVEPGADITPTSAEYTEAEVVYYYNPDPNTFLQPMYLFTGKTTLTDGRPATIIAILPAIDPQFLKQP
ncbi:hypothetical protein IH980_02765 [Patescibacteria group bacterium]|nr:hypothetical protein [Patescibacteria group bacterium]